MAIRNIDEALVLDIIESGVDKELGGGHHWLYKRFAGRPDKMSCVAAVIDQVLVSEKPIVREVSQGWNTNISYAEDGVDRGDRFARRQERGAAAR